MDEVNKSRIQEIEERVKAATPGEWFTHESADWHDIEILTDKADGDEDAILEVVATVGESTDAELIANAPADLCLLIEQLRETERQLARLRADADKFRDLVRTLLTDDGTNAGVTVEWCMQHGADISVFESGGAWWEHDPAEMLPKLSEGKIQEALAMYVLNVDRMEVRRMLDEWLKRNASTATVSSERGGAE